MLFTYSTGLSQLLNGKSKEIHGANFVYLDLARIGQNFFLMPVAAGERASVATFYSSNQDPGTSSLFKPDGTQGFNVGAVFSVPVIKMADWLAKFPFGQNGVEYIEHVKVSAVHFVKLLGTHFQFLRVQIDSQGSDYYVIKVRCK